MTTNTPDDGDVTLTGGNMSVVVRRGEAVHRTAGPWTPTVHRLLDHLRARGVDWLPRPLGLDAQGREVLTFLPGTVPSYPMPSWVWHEDVLTTAATWLARVHEAGSDFDVAGAIWQLPAREPAEVVCLNDVAPHNMVFDDVGRLTGWIDVDVASPGPRVWDVAHFAYRLVPLTGGPDAGTPDPQRARARLVALCDAYAGAGERVAIAPEEVVRVAVERLADLAAFTSARATAGAGHVAAHVAVYERDAAWIAEHAARLSGTGTPDEPRARRPAG